MSRNRKTVCVLTFQVARAKVVAYTRADLTKSNFDHEDLRRQSHNQNRKRYCTTKDAKSTKEEIEM